MINFGIVGLNWGSKYINLLHRNKDFTIRAISSKRYNPIAGSDIFYEYYTSEWIELCHDPSIDVIVAAVGPSLNGEIAKEALIYGKHVIIEKPICFSSEQVWELKNIAERNNRNAIVNFIHLWQPEYLKWKRQKQSKYDKLYFYGFMEGNVVRKDYDFYWDYLSHMLAVFYDSCNINSIIKFKKDESKDKLYGLYCNLKRVSAHLYFSLGENKTVEFGVTRDLLSDFLFKVVDRPENNPLKNMFNEFTSNLICNGNTLNNLDLAYKVTKSLEMLK